jgi:predicted RNA-binding protein
MLGNNLLTVSKTFDLLKLKDKFHFITNADATSSNLCSSSSVSAMRATSSANNKQVISCYRGVERI